MIGADTFRTLATEVAQALAPLEQLLASPEEFSGLLLEMGWEFAGLVPQPVAGLSSEVADLRSALDVVLAGNPSPDDLEHLYLAVRELAQSIRELGNLPPGSFPAELESSGFVDEFPGRLLQLLVVTQLQENHPRIETVLRVLGIVRVERVPASGDRPAYIARLLALPDLSELVRNPPLVMTRAYGWGTSEFRYQEVFEHVSDLATYFGLDLRLDQVDPSMAVALEAGAVVTGDPVRWSIKMPLHTAEVAGELMEAGLGLFALPQLGPHLPGLSILPYAQGELAKRIQLSDHVFLVIESTFDLTGGVGIVLRPNEPIDILTGLLFGNSAGEPSSSGRIRIGLEVGEEDDPTILLAIGGVGRLEANRISLMGEAVVESADGHELKVELNLAGAAVVLKPDDADSFAHSLFKGGGAAVNFDLTLGLSTVRGFYFAGSGGLEISIPTHISLGGITFEAIIVGVSFPTSSIQLEVGTSIKAKLGPLTALVENIGLRAPISFPDNGGNLGVAQIDFGFKPPKGVGLSLDAGGFKGGGFLRLDSEKGEYVGALELDFNGLFSVKAIGIINTKMPDGSKGFSLLIVIAAEFTPIQLGYGFTLNGVGGILGLNRSIDVNALADGIRTNSIKSILFPQDIVANITRIVSDIKRFFPPQPDHFVFGPMAKLGWGPVITIELGLLLDLPNPMFAIVGVLKAILPEGDAPVLRLQANFIGIVDFDQGYTFFRSDLFESRLLAYTITGSTAFLASWGAQKTVAMSVGGFHPDFRDIPSIPALPNGFRNMARIGLSLLADDNPRLKVEAYFAITSNTAQFGARVELYALAAGFNIYGFLGFDVLFQFDPFRFVAKLDGGVALRRNTTTIASINLNATLTGTSPWEVQGKASLSFLFFSVSVPFQHTWGDPITAIIEAIEDLLGLLQRELNDVRNWRAELPQNNHLRVTLREFKPPTEEQSLVIHPAGVLTFSQKSLPLEAFEIEKFGNKKPLGENKFQISNTNSKGKEIPADFESVKEQFAPANFTKLTDSQKLSRPSFENLPSGFSLSSTNDLLVARPVSRPVIYELSYLKKKENSIKGLASLVVRSYDRLVKGSSVRKSTLSKQQNRASMNAPKQVVLPEEGFVITNIADLKPFADTGGNQISFASHAQAFQRREEILRRDPKLASKIQVVSSYEVNRN